MSINISILVLNMWNQLYFNSCACFLMSKWHLLPVISNGRQALLPTASWYLSHQGKCQHWKEHCFTLLEKRGVRSASIVGFSLPWTAGSSRQPANPRQLTCTHTSCAAAKGLYPLPVGDRYSSGLTRCRMTYTLRHTNECTVSVKQGKTYPQNDKSGMIKKVFWTKHLFLCEWEKVQRQWRDCFSQQLHGEFFLFHSFILALKIEYKHQGQLHRQAIRKWKNDSFYSDL